MTTEELWNQYYDDLHQYKALSQEYPRSSIRRAVWGRKRARLVRRLDGNAVKLDRDWHADIDNKGFMEQY